MPFRVVFLSTGSSVTTNHQCAIPSVWIYAAATDVPSVPSISSACAITKASGLSVKFLCCARYSNPVMLHSDVYYVSAFVYIVCLNVYMCLHVSMCLHISFNICRTSNIHV